MGKLSKTARASGATGLTKSSGPARVQQKFKVGHRAKKFSRAGQTRGSAPTPRKGKGAQASAAATGMEKSQERRLRRHGVTQEQAQARRDSILASRASRPAAKKKKKKKAPRRPTAPQLIPVGSQRPLYGARSRVEKTKVREGLSTRNKKVASRCRRALEVSEEAEAVLHTLAVDARKLRELEAEVEGNHDQALEEDQLRDLEREEAAAATTPESAGDCEGLTPPVDVLELPNAAEEHLEPLPTHPYHHNCTKLIHCGCMDDPPTPEVKP